MYIKYKSHFDLDAKVQQCQGIILKVVNQDIKDNIYKSHSQVTSIKI